MSNIFSIMTRESRVPTINHLQVYLSSKSLLPTLGVWGAVTFTSEAFFLEWSNVKSNF